MIEVRELTKRYGSEVAVDRISFTVRSGEVLGFLGPNGAGKTTTIKVITCYLPPTEGMVWVEGLDVRQNSLAIRQRIGYLPENTPLYPDMVTYDYLEFMAAMRGLQGAVRRRRLAEVIEVCGLGDVLAKRIDTLSKGYRQRVGLAQAMVHDPPILILDEPTSGLDPNQIVEIRSLIKTLGREKTVILSTHILPEVQASCDRVLIIHRGQIVADGTPDELQSAHGGQRILFGVQQVSETEVRSALARIDGVQLEEVQAESDGTLLLRLSAEDQQDLRPELFRLAVERGWTLTELHRERVDLEEVFRQLTMN